jgi:hypothetical protein
MRAAEWHFNPSWVSLYGVQKVALVSRGRSIEVGNSSVRTKRHKSPMIYDWRWRRPAAAGAIRTEASVGFAIDRRRAGEEDPRRRRAIDSAGRSIDRACEIGERRVGAVRLLVIAPFEHQAWAGGPATRRRGRGMMVKMSEGRYRRAGDKGCSDKTTRDDLHQNLPADQCLRRRGTHIVVLYISDLYEAGTWPFQLCKRVASVTVVSVMSEPTRSWVAAKPHFVCAVWHLAWALACVEE